MNGTLEKRASTAIELLLVTPVGRRLAERFRSPGTSLHAPHLIDVEVAQVIRRYVLARTLSTDRGRLALRHLAELDLERYPKTPLLPRIWALRENLTAYDATYVALSEVGLCHRQSSILKSRGRSGRPAASITTRGSFTSGTTRVETK